MWQLGTELDDVPELAVDHALYVEGNGSRRYAPSWCMLLLMMMPFTMLPLAQFQQTLSQLTECVC